MTRPPATGERWVALFLLAVLLFSPQFLSISGGHRLLSLPLVYVYLFLAWALVIGLAALAAEGSSAAHPGRSAPRRGETAGERED